MSDLQQIGLKYHTDKADSNHTFKGQTYLDVYEQYFEPIRFTAERVLELGVLDGRSLKTWRDYFLIAEAWGIDINPAAKQDYGPRIHVETGSQDDPETIARCAPGQQFDVVIDDGSHLVVHLLKSYELLWPRVKPGGWYVMEDMNCSYNDMTPYRSVWPGQSFNGAAVDMNNAACRPRLNALLLERIGRLDGPWGDIRAIRFHAMQIFFQKVEE